MGTVYRSSAAVGRRRWRTFGQFAYIVAAAYLVAIVMGWL